MLGREGFGCFGSVVTALLAPAVLFFALRSLGVGMPAFLGMVIPLVVFFVLWSPGRSAIESGACPSCGGSGRGGSISLVGGGVCPKCGGSGRAERRVL